MSGAEEGSPTEAMPVSSWEAPEWIRPYLPLLETVGFGSVEGMMSGWMGRAVEGLFMERPTMVVAVQTRAMVALLTVLHERGMLATPTEDGA